MMEGIGKGAKKTEDIIKRYFPRTYRNMAQLKDDRLMKCRISHQGQKTIWSGSALIYQHTHLHVDKNNTEDAVSAIYMLQPDDETAIFHVLAEYRMAEENVQQLGIGIKLMHNDVMISHPKQKFHGTTKPVKKGRLALIYFQHDGCHDFSHSNAPSGMEQLRRLKQGPEGYKREVNDILFKGKSD